MAISCTPSDLAAAAKCYCFPDQKAVDSIIIYLLAQIAADTSTPAQLAVKAKCFCIPDKTVRDGIITYLLCQIAAAEGA